MKVTGRVGLIACALSAFLGIAGLSAQGVYAAAGPAWSANIIAKPSTFSRSGEGLPNEELQEYVVLATNVGSVPSAGPIIVTDTLPTGVEPNPFSEPLGVNRNAGGEFTMTCSTSGQAITCEGEEAVVPGESLAVYIPVLVNASAASEVEDRVEVAGGGAPAVQDALVTAVGGGAPPFGLAEGPDGFSNTYYGAESGISPAAGAHPYQAAFNLNFNTTILPNFFLYGAGEPKVIGVTLPRGLYANPTATTVKCTEAELESDETVDPSTGLIPGGCPRASQVGVATVMLRLFGAGLTPFVKPVFNMMPAPGAPAEFAFDAEAGVYVHMFGHVNSSGEYEVAAKVPDIPAKLQIASTNIMLWGSPSDPSHDPMRGLANESGGDLGTEGCIGRTEAQNLCPTERLTKAFLTLPSDCQQSPLVVSTELSSWQEPGVVVRRQVNATDLGRAPITASACSSLRFSPSISSQANNQRADSPTGLTFNLHQPQDQEYASRSTANLRDATITLPAGVSVNPSSANGLDVCSEGQIGVQRDGRGRLRFSETPQSCPNASKIGTLEVSTPLLEHALSGGVYVAKPFANPFGSLLSIYLAIEDEETGIVSKLAGQVTPDKQSGQLMATFTENPELPLEDIKVQFFSGDAASLKTPLTCGTFTTLSALTPWSAPEGPVVQPSDSFATSIAAQGSGACPPTEGAASFKPRFTAGTVSSSAGSYSPFVLALAREDGEQHITAIDTTLPKGLLGKPAGIPYCSEADIAEARAREVPQRGVDEQTHPSCPSSTEVGSVTVGAGAGPKPYFVQGHAYWAGPYKGAPLSLVVIAPAVAGPFDLGAVVTRVALNVEEFSAQIHAVSDPLPTIREGIPLDLRSISLNVNRPNFILNPTSCREKQITGSLGSQAGASAPVLTRFQAVGCNRLAFKPTLKLSLSGATKRTGHPALKAVVTYPKEGAYSNIARAQVGLPHSEFLDQGNLDKVCTRPQLKTATCPKRSIYGRAKAWSPLLDKPLEGPVFLGVGFGDKLPDLVAELNGQIRVLLKGKVDTDAQKGIRNTFEAVPDAPVSRFELRLKGGKKYGLLENSENICKKAQQAHTRFSAQNGIVNVALTAIGNSCGAKKKHSKK